MIWLRFQKTALLILIFHFGNVCLAAERPMVVSPGNESTFALIEAHCPSFSWGRVDGAESYELEVYHIGKEENEALVLKKELVGSASSWTPSLDQCLERGGQYAWSVRAVGSKTSSDWAIPSLFEVRDGPGEAEFEAALRVVKQYLDTRGAPSSNIVSQASSESTTRSTRGNSRQAQASGHNMVSKTSSGNKARSTTSAVSARGLNPTLLGVAGGIAAASLGTSGDIDIGGDLLKNGDVFIHTPGGASAGNTAFGRFSLSNVTPESPNFFDGKYNLAFGSSALSNTTTGRNNLAIGDSAMQLNLSGGENTAVGQDALKENETGWYNVALGKDSLRANSGASNIGIGYSAGKLLTTGSNNIHIGNEGIAAESTTIKIGTQGTQTTAYIAGIHGTSLTGNNVVVTSDGQLGVGPATDTPVPVVLGGTGADNPTDARTNLGAAASSHSHTESDITNLVHTTDTNAGTLCSAGQYLDGDGTCKTALSSPATGTWLGRCEETTNDSWTTMACISVIPPAFKIDYGDSLCACQCPTGMTNIMYNSLSSGGYRKVERTCVVTS